MRAGAYALLLAAFGLAGCDRLTGEADQRINDAEAIGYACRVSLKTPEECMKENEAQSPTYVLDGWKAANKDIENDVIDPSMGKKSPVVHLPQSAVAETSDTTDNTVKKIALPDLKAAAKAGKAETEKPAKH